MLMQRIDQQVSDLADIDLFKSLDEEEEELLS